MTFQTECHKNKIGQGREIFHLQQILTSCLFVDRNILPVSQLTHCRFKWHFKSSLLQMAYLHAFIYESPVNQDGTFLTDSISTLQFYRERVPTIHSNDRTNLEIYPFCSDGAPVFNYFSFQPFRQYHSNIGGHQSSRHAIQDEHPVDQSERVRPSSDHNLYAVYGC